jgi:hypothetical protein
LGIFIKLQEFRRMMEAAELGDDKKPILAVEASEQALNPSKLPAIAPGRSETELPSIAPAKGDTRKVTGSAQAGITNSREDFVLWKEFRGLDIGASSEDFMMWKEFRQLSTTSHATNTKEMSQQHDVDHDNDCNDVNELFDLEA